MTDAVKNHSVEVFLYEVHEISTLLERDTTSLQARRLT